MIVIFTIAAVLQRGTDAAAAGASIALSLNAKMLERQQLVGGSGTSDKVAGLEQNFHFFKIFILITHKIAHLTPLKELRTNSMQEIPITTQKSFGV
jgi:hypothetical protein